MVDDEASGIGIRERVVDRAPADVTGGFCFGDDGSVFLAERIASSFAHVHLVNDRSPRTVARALGVGCGVQCSLIVSKVVSDPGFGG